MTTQQRIRRPRAFARTTVSIGALATASVLLLGCASAGGGERSGDDMAGMDHGSSASSTRSSTAAATDAPGSGADEANEADDMFVTMMIPHHPQAVEMSDMLLAKDGVDQRVSALAQRIKDAQAPEISQLQQWSDAWGLDAAGMDHGSHGMDGMMTEEDMAALEQASGADASVLYLQQMIAHHSGAVEMAETEISDGAFADAVEMAENIVSTQNAEIDEMTVLLDEL